MTDHHVVIDALETAIANGANTFGPNGAPAEFWDGDGPVGDVMLSEWVTVAAWVDSEGRTFVTSASPPHMTDHHRTGLLYAAIE